MDNKTYTEKRFFKWVEDEVAVSLRACSGSYGGGQRSIYCVERVNALCWDDWKGPNNQYVGAGKLIIEVWDDELRTNK